MLEVALRHRFGDFNLDVQFQTAGGITALFGPSGCGKTTIINAISGLLKPQEGLIKFDGEILVDTKSRLWVPPHRRRIGVVFQDARLLPHLNVAQNLTYGQWFTPKKWHYLEQASIVKVLGLGHLMGRKPGQLSGGEKQRVALGRALLQSPRLLIMDEPLASLDDERKVEILPFIERLRDEFKIPTLYVSHSTAEVLRLAQDVLVMSHGQIVASGASAQVLPAVKAC